MYLALSRECSLQSSNLGCFWGASYQDRRTLRHRVHLLVRSPALRRFDQRTGFGEPAVARIETDGDGCIELHFAIAGWRLPQDSLGSAPGNGWEQKNTNATDARRIAFAFEAWEGSTHMVEPPCNV